MLVSRRRLASLALACTALLTIVGPAASAAASATTAAAATDPAIGAPHAPTHGTDAVLHYVEHPNVHAPLGGEGIRLALAIAAAVACALFVPFCRRLASRRTAAIAAGSRSVSQSRAPPAFLPV